MDRRVAHTRTDGSSPRRNYSEIDMNSLRRISEALLLAQNRARLATERANRCERVLRMVMAQANPQLAMSLRNELDGTPQRGLLDDTMSEWDMLQSVTHQRDAEVHQSTPPSTTSLTSSIIQNYDESSPRRRHSIDVHGTVVEESVEPTSDENEALWASMIAPERNIDVAILAKEIVDNLSAAAIRSDQRVQKLHHTLPSGKNVKPGRDRVFRGARSALASSSSPPSSLASSGEKNWLEAWKHRLFRIEIYAVSPLQFMAGILVGVVVGMTVTRQLLLRRHGGGKNQLLKMLSSSYYKRRSGAADVASSSTFQYFPYGEDDMSYMMHPAAVEVA